ncbi:MAG: hypothetical protein UY92_C0003G0054 [Candidatus Magasanikbacteria bacterium GW2011_GWA2_56_11]|uniref:ABC transporter permease n=1 Tax=Candidatus Magasanikbacteria bacterium GW2011_GWA2_56_11 TaxID=1619044 RepID=A0A0G1YHC9_9BACT|nr:MAG: hypothetical protein UY92_C0003G0054 [Candidatus Magasanikbacteria bacterium GW2011_GWA2_56_11]
MSVMSRKYLVAYANGLSSAFQYRLNLGLLFVSHLVSLSGLVYLWLAVYAAGESLPGYSLPEIITYYLVLTALRITIADGIGMGFKVSEDIREGLITHYLLKPFSYSLEQGLLLAAQASINLVFALPPFIILGLFINRFIELPDLGDIAAFALLTLIGLIFYYLVYLLSAFSSFWIEKGSTAIYAMIVVSLLLSGSLLPLDLFPDWFQTASRYAPFQYLMYVPIQGFLGQITDWSRTLAVAAVWIVLLAAAARTVWLRGLKKYEAAGR